VTRWLVKESGARTLEADNTTTVVALCDTNRYGPLCAVGCRGGGGSWEEARGKGMWWQMIVFLSSPEL
jgi:hypothetical protein